MPKVWLNNQRGFSAVEVLLAAAVFGVIVTAIVGALVYGRASTATAGDRNRANLLAEEGLEAARNMRDAGYANLVDGTYGLVLSGGVWTLSGSSDTTGNFTRSVTIAAAGTNRKTITANVTWPQGAVTSQTSISTLLTNWYATLPKLWANAIQAGSVDVTGTVAGYKIATQGDYAYLVRNAGTANFYVINISNPASPTVVGTLNLAANPTNIAVSGTYAYVSSSSDTAELQIINIATPAAPTLTGTYNASGNGNGQGVYVVGTNVYLARAANGSNDEFVMINASNPAAPTRFGGYSLNVSMYEVYVSGTVAFVATASDTQEVLVLNMVVPSLLTLGTSINLSGTTDATTLDGYGTVLFVGQGTTLYAINLAILLGPVVSGSVTMGGTIQDVSADSVHNYAHVGTNGTTTEFQVVNATNTASPTILRSVDVTGSATTVTGVAYNATKDVTPAAVSLTNMEVAVFAPN